MTCYFKRIAHFLIFSQKTCDSLRKPISEFPALGSYYSAYALYCNCTLPRFRPLHSGGVGGGEGREEGRRVEGGDSSQDLWNKCSQVGFRKTFPRRLPHFLPSLPPSFLLHLHENLQYNPTNYTVHCVQCTVSVCAFRSTSSLLTAPSLPLYFLPSNCSFPSALLPSY